jgi:hypothetical protein
MARIVVLGLVLAAAMVAAARAWSPEGVTARAIGQPHGVEATCSTRSYARFPGAYRAEENLVVGPLALVGAGAKTSARTIADVGGNKFPALVRRGHRVTLQIPLSARAIAALGYGPLPQGEITLANAHDTVTFESCRPGDSSRGHDPATFWSGAVVTPEPACVPLDVYVDGEPTPTRVLLEMGVSCEAA